MTFNIGSQTGGVINNVAGDQHITGGQRGAVTAGEARQALGDLGRAVAAAGLDETTAAQARAQVTEMETEMRTGRPDRSRFAGALERLTRLLSAAGSLSTAGAALIGPLHTLACWLGAAGASVLHLLPALA